MKKLIITFLISLILFVVIFSNKEIIEFSQIYKANSMYIHNNSTWASNIYDSINEDNISETNQNILKFLKWNIKYKEWKYFEALLEFNKINWNNEKLKFYKYNVLWDTKYRLWEFWNDFDKLKYWPDVLNNYMSAINQNINEDKKNTIYNYNLVKNKLDELKKRLEKEQKQREEEQKNKQEEDKQNQNWSWSQKQEQWDQNNSQSGQLNNIQNKTWKNWWTFNWVWNSQNNWDEEIKLTPEEKKELDNYTNSLKEFQKNNNQYLQRWTPKKSDSWANQDMFDRMMEQFKSDPFFKEIMPQDDWAKDW